MKLGSIYTIKKNVRIICMTVQYTLSQNYEENKQTENCYKAL